MNSKKQQILDMETRLKIAVGLDQGVEHLHHDCVPKIIHRDINSSNLLLDSEMEAHLGDFGLAKMINDNNDSLNTESNMWFQGSYGHCSRTELGRFSGAKIYPGRGIRFIHSDSQQQHPRKARSTAVRAKIELKPPPYSLIDGRVYFIAIARGQLLLPSDFIPWLFGSFSICGGIVCLLRLWTFILLKLYELG